MLHTTFLALLIAAPTLLPGGGPCAFDAGREALKAKDWERAALYFQDARSCDYKPAESSYLAACARSMLGQKEKALEELAAAYAANLVDPEQAYIDPRLEPLRCTPQFRRLMRESVLRSELEIVPEGEPGTPLVVQGKIVARDDGTTVPGARLFVYQTGADGRYSAPKDDSENPRLFGYLEACDAGTFELTTVLPGSYPESKAPRHIHYVVEAPGYQRLEGEILFDDDPNLDEAMRRTAAEHGFPIVAARAAKGSSKLKCQTAIALVRAKV